MLFDKTKSYIFVSNLQVLLEKMNFDMLAWKFYSIARKPSKSNNSK